MTSAVSSAREKKPSLRKKKTDVSRAAQAVSLPGMSQEEVKPIKKKELTPLDPHMMLEENRELVLKRQKERSMARQNSKEFVNKLIADDEKVMKEEKAKEASRRLAQKELSGDYKSRIAEKETEKATSYRSKREAAVNNVPYFPYTEGEKIAVLRKARNAEVREELQGFLRDQLESKPLAKERLFHGDLNYSHQYALGGSERSQVSTAGSKAGTQPTSPMKQPMFLTRSRDHMSRRTKDEHVQKALEEEVERTKEMLEARLREKEKQAQSFSHGTMVNDALRYNSAESQKEECLQHQRDIIKQMEERRLQNEKERKERHNDAPGYFGPDEKGLASACDHGEHARHLIYQVEAEQRKKAARVLRIQEQERRIVKSAVDEIAQERKLDYQKRKEQREVMVETWDSQRRIKEVTRQLEAVRARANADTTITTLV